MADEDVSKRAAFGPWSLNALGFIKTMIDCLGGMVNIGQNHREIHEGEFYEFGHTFIDVADAATIRLRFLTGAKNFHYGIEVMSEGKAFAAIRKGTTYTGDGTEITPINNNDASSETALLTVFHTPTVNVAGSLLTPANGILILGGTGPLSVGGDIKADEERVSALTTDYLIEVTNDSGQAKDITILVGGYEELIP